MGLNSGGNSTTMISLLLCVCLIRGGTLAQQKGMDFRHGKVRMPRSTSHLLDGSQSPDYTEWTRLAEKRASLLEVADLIDDDIEQLIKELIPMAEAARRSVTREKQLSNFRAATYGLSTMAASAAFIKDILASGGGTLSENDNANIAANLAYGYGYGAPYLLEGQLEDPDPGCGGFEMDEATRPLRKDYFKRTYRALGGADGTVHPSNLLDVEAFPNFQSLKMIGIKNGIRDAVSCFGDDSAATSILNKLVTLDVAIELRLSVTQKVIDTIEKETVYAQRLGYDPLYGFTEKEYY